MTDLTVNVNKLIEAPIERVFDAWLNPETLSRFILPMPGMPRPQVETDAKQGGNFSIIMQVGENKIPHTGSYMEISRPHKLVFTWQSPFSSSGSTVTLKFSAVGDRKTNVELSHIKFIDEQHRDNHEGGWTNILQCLNEIIR